MPRLMGGNTEPIMRNASIQAALTQQLYIQGLAGVRGSLVAAAVLTFTLWGQVSKPALVLWFVCYASACGWGEMLARHFFRSEVPPDKAPTWGRRFTENALAGALLWAATPLFLFPERSLIHQALLAFVLGGVSVGIVMSHCASRPAHLPFILMVFLSLIARFVYEHDRVHLTMGFLLAVFLIYLIAAAGRMRTALIQSLELRFENRELVENLRREKNGMAALNNELLSEIADRAKAEVALRESEEKYRLLAENANDGIVLLQNCEIKFANARVRSFLGLTTERPTLESLLDLLHPDDRDSIVERYHRSMAGESVPPRQSFRIVDGNGNVRWFESSAAAGKWDGEPALFYFMSDITARRRMEEERLKAQKLESIGILAGGIAHDFNNILASILGNISIAKMRVPPKDVVFDRLSKAEEACVRAESLTRQLLTFSRGGAPVKKLCNVALLLHQSCGFALRGSNVRLDICVPEDLWPADADEGQINQVVHNLILNADQAMPQGGAVRVSAENLHLAGGNGLPVESGPFLHIEVHDHGVGIPEEHLPRIFDPYFSTKPKGTGLGLASAYSIMRNHGGIITVESEPKVGTVFRVYLPASPGEIPPAEKTERPILKGEGNVLLMDDDEAVREVAGEMLSSLGFEVTTAKDGAEAVDLYTQSLRRAKPFDVVILDLTVPGAMGGHEAITKLREVDPAVRAVVSSGFSTNPVMADYKAHGFSGVIPKPFTLRTVSETLTEVISGELRRDAAPPK